MWGICLQTKHKRLLEDKWLGGMSEGKQLAIFFQSEPLLLSSEDSEGSGVSLVLEQVVRQ
jgi:hypothetical protein